jgi:NADH-quinone oxidoreductase subunit D
MYTWRDREKVLDLLSAITGNRVNYSINTIGGVRRDISPEIARKTLEVINEVEERTQYYIKIALEETTLKNRLSGVGILSKEDARSYGAVGPTLRASGIAQDVRKDDPYIAYSELDFNVCTSDQCDVFGRTVVRLLELLESFKMIRQIIDGLPEGDIAAKAPRKIPESEVTSRYEAPRGECLHYIRSNGTDKPDRVKVRAPSLANFQSVPKMMEDRFIADSTIIIAAIDPCFSCTDRMISIKGEGPRAGLSSWEDLRLHGIEWYAGCGVDFKSINLS